MTLIQLVDKFCCPKTIQRILNLNDEYIQYFSFNNIKNDQFNQILSDFLPTKCSRQLYIYSKNHCILSFEDNWKEIKSGRYCAPKSRKI